MDLLVLADSDGCVDMTPSAISRRTNVPPEVVETALEELASPDPLTRSQHEEGRRIVPIDSARPWGWRIVNYEHYRQIRDEESRRSYFRDKKREQRARTDSRQVIGGKKIPNHVRHLGKPGRAHQQNSKPTKKEETK